MKKSTILSCILGLSLCLFACGRTEQKTEIVENPAQPPVEEVQVSQPPAYEVPLRPKDVIGNDGVWEAEKEPVFGVAVPKLRENVNCDGIRYCNFTVKMTSKQVNDFIQKYFPYQNIKYFPAINAYEVTRDIREELRDDGIVPSFDPLIQRPKKGDEVHISIEWSKTESAYAWYYKSPFAFHEDEMNIQQQEREERENSLAVAQKVVTNFGFTQQLTSDEIDFLISRDVVIEENGRVSDESFSMLKNYINENINAADNNNSESEPSPADQVPQLQHITL